MLHMQAFEDYGLWGMMLHSLADRYQHLKANMFLWNVTYYSATLHSAISQETVQ